MFCTQDTDLKFYLKNLNLTGNRFQTNSCSPERNKTVCILHAKRRDWALSGEKGKQESQGHSEVSLGLPQKAFKVYHMITVHLALCAYTTFSLRQKNDSATGGCRESPF